MKLFVGADLGTSGLKMLLLDENGAILNVVTKPYELILPCPLWSEERPVDWIEAFDEGFKELLEGYDKKDVCGIGTGGQMHGLVTLDENDEVIRNAILWNDGRCESEVSFLNNEIGKSKLISLTGNIAFAGFTAPKLLWMKNNEPENFERIRKIMLPKDYLTYVLTGIHATDFSDASGMLLLDVEHKCWSEEMLSICNVDKCCMPSLYESYEKVGFVKKEIADKLGIGYEVAVAAGAGDNAAAALGTGTIGNGKCNISLGTSGTVFLSADEFHQDDKASLHSFADASGHYHLMGCMLSAASAGKWFQETILGTGDYRTEEAEIKDEKLGHNKTFFLPYLMGERSPINDTSARGAFIGMSMDTTRADMLQAVFEGVAFALRDSIEVARGFEIDISRSTICGGGSKSKLWVKMIASIMNFPIDMPLIEEGPGFGGALLAMVAAGYKESVEQAVHEFCGVKSTVMPNKELVALYEDRYQEFKKIYPTLKELFKQLN